MTTARKITEKDYEEFACSIFSIIQSTNPAKLPGILKQIEYNIQDHHYPDPAKKSRVHVYITPAPDKFTVKYDVHTTGGANYDYTFEFSHQKAVITKKYSDDRYGGSNNDYITVENGKLGKVQEFDKRKGQSEFSEVTLTPEGKKWKLDYFFSCYKMHEVAGLADQFQAGVTASPQPKSVTSPSIETKASPLPAPVAVATPAATSTELQQQIANLQRQLELQLQIESLEQQSEQARRDAASARALLATIQRSRDTTSSNDRTAEGPGNNTPSMFGKR